MFLGKKGLLLIEYYMCDSDCLLLFREGLGKGINFIIERFCDRFNLILLYLYCGNWF